jgi:hypothetical protein
MGYLFRRLGSGGHFQIVGRIHVSVDDLTGRIIGAQCGQAVWALAREYFDGSITNTPITLNLFSLSAGQEQLRFNTLRGFFYNLQSTVDLRLPFTNELLGIVEAVNSSVWFTNSLSARQRFYRVMQATGP